MTGSDFEAAVLAAGALAFAVDADTVVLTGDPAVFGLTANRYERSAFEAMIAPGDREAFAEALEAESMDIRMRLIDASGRVRYARLLGGRDGSGAVRGLVTPAGWAGKGARGRLDRETDLARAVSAGEIIAHYQPIVTLETRRLAGFEALARWKKPGAGSLPPDEFLPLATELDLLGKIGDGVREMAAKDVSAWRASAPGAPLFVTVNASAGELLRPGFAENLLEDLAEAKLRPGAYKLEIAETEIMREPDRAETVLNTLRDGGVGLAIDDFGTGYSSLARLERFPFDTVKIDRYFVRALAANGTGGKVVESVIQLARHFGMTVVAEGVEDGATEAMLRDMGCDFAQGFRYAGALTPGAAALTVKDGVQGRFAAAG